MSPAKRDLWEDAFGFAPHKVWVGERADKKGILYLRWWRQDLGNWRWKSLGVGCRDEKGRLLPHVQAMAREKAREQYELLTGKVAPATMARSTPLTLSETWLFITDSKTGQYPHDTPHRREVGRALADLSRILQPDTPWSVVDRTRLRVLMRTRVDELRAKKLHALRSAEITMSRVFAVAAWLRDNGHIPHDACLPPRKWREELEQYVEATHGGRIPETNRPRHTLEEMRLLLDASYAVDPRFGFLMALGAELRLGQVVRCRRSDLSLDHWTLTVHGRGKKGGEVVELTTGQRVSVMVALSGYLRELEAECPDYPLFPQGKLRGVSTGDPVAIVERHAEAPPLNRRTINAMFTLAEQAADVTHMDGRGPYGIRRQVVDKAKALKISREALQKLGGWSDTQVPDNIYAEQEMQHARHEAMEARAEIRGENVPSTYPEEKAQGTANAGSDDTAVV